MHYDVTPMSEDDMEPIKVNDTVVVIRVDSPVWSGLVGRVGTVTDFYERGTRVCVKFDGDPQQYVFQVDEVKIF